ncbi:MAG TPA: Crp/Fnr family transcriptional regulator, partial [bacterium]|nr:Crp/Fnr family transcriptional regulator [bacterium]
MLGSEYLAKVPVFGALDEKAREELARYLKPARFKKEAVIVSREEPGTALFLLVKGKVKVVLYGPSGREVILSMLKDGDFFGEMSLLDGKPRSASVVAIQDTEVLVLDRADFVRFVETKPSVALSILGEMSRRLREADQKIGSLALLDVYGRVARALLDLAKKEGEKTEGGVIVKDRPTHQQLAG